MQDSNERSSPRSCSSLADDTGGTCQSIRRMSSRALWSDRREQVEGRSRGICARTSGAFRARYLSTRSAETVPSRDTNSAANAKIPASNDWSSLHRAPKRPPSAGNSAPNASQSDPSGDKSCRNSKSKRCFPDSRHWARRSGSCSSHSRHKVRHSGNKVRHSGHNVSHSDHFERRFSGSVSRSWKRSAHFLDTDGGE